jgi:hypothetical protein
VRRLVAAAVAVGAVLTACSPTDNGHPAAASTSSGHPRVPPTGGASAPHQQPVPRLLARIAPWRLPAARSREVALADAAGLVVAGGLSSAHVSTSTVWTLSPTTGQVQHTSALAAAVHDAAGLVLNRSPTVVAGGNTTTVDDVQRLSDDGGMTRVVGHLPQPRSDLVAASVEGSGYVLGGFDGTTSLSAVLRTQDGRHFTAFGHLRLAVRYAAVVAITSTAGDQLLLFGGEHNGVPVDDVQDVDLRTGRVRIVGHLPEPLSHEAAFSLDDRTVWLAGGRSHDQLQSRLWRWDVSRRRAVVAGHLPYAVADAGLAVGGSTAYLLGGETPEPTARVVELQAK